MCVYKEKDSYLRKAIESILNQTYKSFEFVIIGDTPPSDRERVFGIIEEYASQDDRISFYPNVVNIGLTKSLNIGLGYCTGKYIARMDADDISFPSRLAKQVAFMESNPRFLASGANCEIIDENDQTTGRRYNFNPSSNRLRLNILKGSIIMHPLAIFRRIINGKEVRYDESFKYAQDYALWAWILQYGEISSIEEVLLYYRISENQISTAHLSEQQLCAKRVQKNAFEWLYGLPYSDEFMDTFFCMTIKRDFSLSMKSTLKVFQKYFAGLKETNNKIHVIEFLFDFFIDYFSKTVACKRRYQYIYKLTKKNIKLLVLCEMSFIYQRLICVNNSLNRAFYNCLNKYYLSVKEVFSLPRYVRPISRSAIS